MIKSWTYQVIRSLSHGSYGAQDLIISIEVQFVGGGVEFLSGEFCGAKIYIVGWIQLAHIVAVASGPDLPHSVYLPILSR